MRPGRVMSSARELTERRAQDAPHIADEKRRHRGSTARRTVRI